MDEAALEKRAGTTGFYDSPTEMDEAALQKRSKMY